MNAWVKESKTGKKYFSFSFKAKQTEQAAAAPIVTDDTDDDLPF